MVSCKMRGAGCGEVSTCSPAIYTHEHTLNECSSTHCLAQESSCKEAVTVINKESGWVNLRGRADLRIWFSSAVIGQPWFDLDPQIHTAETAAWRARSFGVLMWIK